MTPDGIAPLGLIPVELDIESLYEDRDRRRKKNADGKAVSSHVHSVSLHSPPSLGFRSLTPNRDGGLKIELLSAHSETEKKSA